jgi:hypothetical protein
MRLTPTAIKAILANEKIHAGAAFNGVLDGLELRLSTAPLPESGDVDPVTDFTVPGYAGYADLACAFGAEHLIGLEYGVDGPLLTFQEGGALTTVTIRAMGLILPGAPDKVYGAENLDLPVTLATADDAFKVVPQVILALRGEPSKSPVVS